MPYINNVLKIWKSLPKNSKKSSIMILILAILSGIFEMVGIGAIVPFIDALIGDDYSQSQTYKLFTNFINISDKSEYIFIVGTVFIILSILSCIFRMLYLRKSTLFAHRIGASLATTVFTNYLHMDYEDSKGISQKMILSLVLSKIELIIYSVTVPIISFIQGIFTLTLVAALLFYIDPKTTSVLILMFSCTYFLMLKIVRNKTAIYSKFLNKYDVLILRQAEIGMSALRDIKLSNSQKEISNEFEIYCEKYRTAQAGKQYISQMPRYIIETIAFIFIASYSYYEVIIRNSGAHAFVLLSVLALSAQRMLPILQNLYFNYIHIKSTSDIISTYSDILIKLNFQPTLISSKRKPIKIKSLSLRDVSFCYKNSNKMILNQVKYTFEAGKIYGIVGDSGAGKSTLIDLIMGFLSPTVGNILVNNNFLSPAIIGGMQNEIAHVPQSIYIKEGSVRENIIFNSEFNQDTVEVLKQAVKISCVDDFTTSPEGLDRDIGDNGALLSGGQRQRIAIARALYKNPSILILDEATNALDIDIEKRIFNNLSKSKNDKITIIITHNYNNLQYCDEIIKIKNGYLSQQK